MSTREQQLFLVLPVCQSRLSVQPSGNSPWFLLLKTLGPPSSPGLRISPQTSVKTSVGHRNGA